MLAQFNTGTFQRFNSTSFKRDTVLAQFNTGIFQRFNSTSFNRWLVCFLIGVFTACIAVIVDVGIEQLSNIKLDLVRKCKFNSTSLPLITVD